MVEIEIPVRRHIKQYLEQKYGAPAKMERKHLEGSFLYELIEDPSRERDCDVGEFSSVINVLLPDRVLMRRGHYLTKTQVATFNAFIDNFIKEEMLKHIHLILRLNPHLEIRLAILDYQQQYQMSDDYLPYETIKKHYYRHRMRLQGYSKGRKSVA